MIPSGVILPTFFGITLRGADGVGKIVSANFMSLSLLSCFATTVVAARLLLLLLVLDDDDWWRRLCSSANEK